jgi:hypothetical protein
MAWQLKGKALRAWDAINDQRFGRHYWNRTALTKIVQFCVGTNFCVWIRLSLRESSDMSCQFAKIWYQWPFPILTACSWKYPAFSVTWWWFCDWFPELSLLPTRLGADRDAPVPLAMRPTPRMMVKHMATVARKSRNARFLRSHSFWICFSKTAATNGKQIKQQKSTWFWLSIE